jgi:hypothetical protein
MGIPLRVCSLRVGCDWITNLTRRVLRTQPMENLLLLLAITRAILELPSSIEKFRAWWLKRRKKQRSL